MSGMAQMRNVLLRIMYIMLNCVSGCVLLVDFNVLILSAAFPPKVYPIR